MKKFLSLMLAVAMLAGILPTISLAAKLDGEITFVEASDSSVVAEFEENDKICAKLAGTAEGSGSADVYAASYNKGELLSCQWLAGQPVTDGMQLDVTTNTIEIAEGADEVRVFVWDLKNNMKPLLESGVIYKKKVTGGSSADVDNTNGVVGTEVNLAGENVSANVPAGVQLENGADELTLSLQSLDSSASGVEAGEGQALASFDVHIDGVSEENNVPIIVTVDNFTKEGYNKGNLELYHVEKDGTKPMNEVSSPDELDEHNTYYYNPETGSLTLALASFSEIAVVADTESGWEGKFDYTWYDADAKELKISNADQLAAFGAIVGGMNGQTQDSFSGQTVKLTADINLADAENEANNNKVSKIFHPIGYYYTDDKNSDGTTGDYYSTVYSFEGIFDGNGHKVANFYQNTWEIKGDYEGNYYDVAMGLFGYVVGGTVKNLTVDNFSSDGEFTPTGVIAAYAVNSTFENIAITNCNPRVYNTGNGGIVGIGGNSDDKSDMKLTFTNITIDNSNKITALWGSWDVACGGLVGMFRGAGHVYMTNCHVAAQMDVYNDVCGNYQYYWYRYSGMMVGTNKNMTTDKDGYTVPETEKFHAENCTVHFGTWNDYYYCELVANSLASYTHDHQFSRLTQISSLDEIKTGNTWTKTGNFLLIEVDEGKTTKTCYHIVNKNGTLTQHNHADAGEETVNGETVLKENNQIVYLPFNQLFTGYGWGVKHIPIYDDGTPNPFAGVTVLDRVEANSVEKFAKADAAKESYTTETTVTIGELFKAAKIEDEKLTIKGDKVHVFVSPVGEDSTAGATYVANTTDWTQGTLTFSGTGEATVTITDYYFCTPTTINVTVTDHQPKVKFETKFTGDFLYRVGNQNAVKLDSLFKASDGAEIGTVAVTIEAVEGKSASGTYTSNQTWTNGTIQFTGTGVVKVTITDNDYCTPTELYLEVVDAVNAITATSATANNVVLLNDIGSGFTVSGRYAVYGNGFTLNYTGNGQYLNNGLKQGVITVSENGTLDNLRIKASIYPSAYLYYGSASLGDYVQGGPSSVEGDKTRYHYQLSSIVAKGNATISNCYVYGGRTNIFVDTGDVTIKDSVLECGTVANVQIQSNASHTITFEDVTTIQYQVNPTIGDTSKVMLGAGVLVGPETTENPTIVLNGNFKQYNWVNSYDAGAASDEVAEKIINGALGATAFNHTINGETASNLGIIYMNTYEATVKNNTGLPYNFGTVSISGINGNAYSLQNATAEQICSDYANADKSTVNGLYQPQFKYSATLGEQLIEKTDNGDEFCYREGDTIYLMFPSGDTKELDLAKLVDIAKYSGQNLNLEISAKDEKGNAVTVTDGKVSLSDAGEYTVTYTVTDSLFYDEEGNQIVKSEGIKYSWDVTIDVSLKDTRIPDARFAFETAKQKMGYYVKSSILSTSVYQYLPFLAGLKIYDYNGKTEYLRFDGDNDFNKVASIEVTNKYSGNKARVVVTLTDGGVIETLFLSRADSGGGSTYTGSIKIKDGVIYFVNDGTTNEKDNGSTTTAAYWYVDYYKFTGNNGVAIQSAKQTFNSTGSSASTPSGSFSTKINYTVTYDANGGNCGQTTGYATSASTAVTLPTPIRSGYLCSGWYTAASGGTRVGGAGDSYTPSANITLYAQWGKPSTVTYNANGGSCGTESEIYSGIALTLPTPTRDGYWLVGWFDAAEGGNRIGVAGAGYNPEGDTTLYAQWSPVYTVTYNANSGSVTPASAEYKGTDLTLPVPTRDGYAFNGWYTAASGGTKIGDGNTSYIPTANITLYAQWKDPVTVTYNADGGSCDTKSQTYLGTALTLPTPTPNTGYKFTGWYTAASGGTKIGDAGASYTPTANITLYAQWEQVSYTITINKQDNATVTVDKTTAHYNDTISVTVSFSQSNSKTLTVKDESGNNVLSKSAAGTYTFTMPASNVTIEASSSGSCVTPDTLVTLSDGSRKRVDEITYDDELLAWDFAHGQRVVTPVAAIVNHGYDNYRVLHLNFADGTTVKVIDKHGFFDVDLNKFVIIDEYNVEDYIGHDFFKMNGNSSTENKLVSFEIVEEYTESYTITSTAHSNAVTEGMLSVTGLPINDTQAFYDCLTVGEGMKYDLQADIEKYGLFAYEEVAEYMTYEQFIAIGGPYLKLIVAKGGATMEELIEIIDLYIPKN